MKKILLLFVLFSCVNSVFSQDFEVINGKIIPIQTYENDSLDFFVIKDNSRLFKTVKGKYNILKSTKFFNLKYDKDGFILNIELDLRELDNINSVERFDCKPFVEVGNTKKYSFNEIEKCLTLIKNLENKRGEKINWNDRGSCDARAYQAYKILKEQNFVTLRTIALVSDSIKSCYATKKNLYPLWLYHVANVMHCDDNKYYVLDPYLDMGKPIELSNWRKMITFGEQDCEKFVMYANNCRVFGHPTFLNNKSGYEWIVGCSCNEVRELKLLPKPGLKKKKTK